MALWGWTVLLIVGGLISSLVVFGFYKLLELSEIKIRFITDKITHKTANNGSKPRRGRII
jgi:hypothetical protein